MAVSARIVCIVMKAEKLFVDFVAARKRATYDMFGEEGLKGGIPVGMDDTGAWTSGYTFHGDADRVFRDFFGGDNPFQGLLVVTDLSKRKLRWICVAP